MQSSPITSLATIRAFVFVIRAEHFPPRWLVSLCAKKFIFLSEVWHLRWSHPYHTPWSECCTAEMPIGKEVAWISLPTYSPGMKLLILLKSELNVCLPAVPHPGCEWNPSFKNSLLSRHKRFYTDFTTFQGHRERWGRGITLPERKTNLSSFALWSLSMCQMSPLPTLYILVSGLPQVAGGCQSSCMRDSFLIATFLGLRAPALFLICLWGSNTAPPNFSFNIIFTEQFF